MFYHTFGCRGEKSGKIVSRCSPGKVVSLCKSDGVLLSNWYNKNIKNTSTIPGRLTWFTWECGPPKKRKIIIQTIMTSGSMWIFGGELIGRCCPKRVDKWYSPRFSQLGSWNASTVTRVAGPCTSSCFWHRWVPRITLDRAVLDDPLDEDETDEVRSGAWRWTEDLGNLHSLKLTAIAPLKNKPGPQKETLVTILKHPFSGAKSC